MSKVDYCNLALSGLLKFDLDRLQSIVNAAARLKSDSCGYDHITPLLNDLDWLGVPERNVITQIVRSGVQLSSWHGAALPQDVIQPVAEVTSRRRLRSASLSALVVPATRRSSLGDRSFAVNAGPRASNSLPPFVTDCSSPLTFKEYPKAYLFGLSF